MLQCGVMLITLFLGNLNFSLSTTQSKKIRALLLDVIEIIQEIPVKNI